ncbi:MAG: antitoxin Xre/MbcA/ParS toxin-binding domain-containing protein [Candidatus Cyclobacteriaceae bacterium M2_1C_046]
MKQSKFENVSSYKEVQHSTNISEEPLIRFNVKRKKVKENVKTLLNYEGVGEVQIPGSFLSVVTEITSLPVSLLIDILDISKSTFYRVKDESVLEQNAIDKLASLLKIYNSGLKAFNDKNDFYDWLTSRVVTLGNQRPVDLLKSENGRGAVADAIDRIEYGVYG